MPEVFHTYSERDKEYGFVKAEIKVLIDEGWTEEEVNLLLKYADFGSDMFWHCKEHPDVREEMIEDLSEHLFEDIKAKEES